MVGWVKMHFFLLNCAQESTTASKTFVTISYIGQGNTVIVESEAI